ncbi:hypothetical protein HYH03_008848 [Edaphochlamys debaryana]|uniref:FAS1 domain-containing protein n=1 Tax=Edaphochlamys debaryana TaxID=47281 RepID=A0A836BZ39_9CHLO|nr:hypothetical protein HYH03_008848 [Edaphochlamys debaryana]|eukprot:KAG2492939.1 hypothetical protein HYH03_008848 [Edaphochlamys debaryana]
MQSALSQAGLAQRFNQSDLNITFFLPTNTAFFTMAATLGISITDLARYPDAAYTTLSFHQVPFAFRIADLAARATAPNASASFPTTKGASDTITVYISPNASPLTARLKGASTTAGITEADVPVGAGFANVINNVLVPWYESMQQALDMIPELASTRDYLRATGLMDAVNATNVTLFAPTNAAWQGIAAELGLSLNGTGPNDTRSADILRQHLLTGQRVLLDSMFPPPGNTTASAANGKNLTYTFNSTSGSFVLMTPQWRGLNARGTPDGTFATINTSVVRIRIGSDSYLYLLNGVLVPAYDTIWDVIRTRPDLTSAAYAMQTISQVPALSNASAAISVFVPTNSAFDKFAASLNLSSTLDLARYSNTLYIALVYHILPQAVRISMLANDANATQTVTKLDTRMTASAPQLYSQMSVTTAAATPAALAARIGSTSATAQLVAADIPAGAGYVQVIDTVLQYWYDNMEQALNTIPTLSVLRDAIVNAGLMAEVNQPNVTLLAPANIAFVGADQSLGWTPTSGDAASQDTLRYHLLPIKVLLEPSLPFNPSTFTAANGKALTLSGTGTSAPYYATSFLYGGATLSDTNLPSDGTAARINVWSIPIGISPHAYLNILLQMLVPTYTSIAQYITKDPSTFGLLVELMRSEGSVYNTLQDARVSNTLLATNNKGLNDFALSLSVTNASLVLASQSAKNAVLRNAVMVGSVNATTLNVDATWDTRLGPRTLRTDRSSGQLQFVADQTKASLATPNNVAILYGRSYVHAITNVLVPASVDLKQPGGAADVAPSALATALALLGALALARLAD